MPRRTVLVAVALLLCAGASSAWAGEGWWSALDDGEAVSLADVLRNPQPYRERLITCFCVFHTAEGAYKYYPPNTPFSEQRHVNFSAWPDGAVLWQEDGFKGDLPFLYLARTHPQRAELLRLPAFTRIEVTGKVRDVIRGERDRPAIEVFSFRVTGHRLGKQVVQEVLRGMNYARAGTHDGNQLAARAFREALRPDLPPVYDMMVRKLLADSLRRLGMQAEAARYEAGESVGLPSLPERAPGEELPEPPMPDDLPAPFDPATSRPPAGPPPEAPTPFGDPDGAPPAAPAASPSDGMPRGFDEPAPPPGAQPPATPPPSKDARAGIPPPRRTRLSGVR